MQGILERINSAVWGAPLIAVLLGTGLLYTLRLGFVQFRLPKLLIETKSSTIPLKKQLKTVCMSLGASMGTGNITGTASALAVGGAGAVLWMWVSAFLGMALVYAENTLSAVYGSEKIKGPMAYLSCGLGSRSAAAVFAVFCIFSSFGMGGMVQVNTFTESLCGCGAEHRVLTAIAVFLLISAIIFGGARRIGTAAQYLLPLAGIAYAAVCIPVIAMNHEHLTSVVSRIFGEALGFRQAAGGLAGQAIAVGIRRGVFSNEAGLGSSPLLHSSADSMNSQAAWSMAEVLADTVCCTLTAVTVLCACDTYSAADSLACLLGSAAFPFLTAVNGLFALCTVIGWYYCGETAFLHLTHGRARRLFCLTFAAISALGAVFKATAVWTLSDIFNGLMAFPNLLGLIMLRKDVKRE
ncbi:alanine or glycine:cation symporter, AGCS family [Ruminococcus sp. YRD2003]|uniref:alanine/glycine:cation symporter family protein n=1 Tax=Ruminococcus sp. YRD2003 TaxID=1452313 RepID=UPI0008CD7828|nr:alanine or glycine:cation symporter, AGCS family [Ruminococcus flavefaciens]